MPVVHFMNFITLYSAMKTYSKHPSRHKRMRLLKVTQIYQPLASLIQTDSVALTHHPQQTLSVLSDILSILHRDCQKLSVLPTVKLGSICIQMN